LYSDEEESNDDDGEEEKDEDFSPRRKKAKPNPKTKPSPKTKKPEAKAKPKPRRRGPSPIDSSDDDLPLRPSGPSDDVLKAAVLEFLKGKDLSSVTKGMVKEALRTKYGDETVKSKKEIIAKGISEGMASM
jgi:DEK C terminal domain